MPSDIAQRVADLREQVNRNQRLRAEAEGNLTLAKRQLKQVDDRLMEMGINPETAEQEATDLETQFNILAAQAEVELQKEFEACEEIVKKSQVTFGD